MEFYVDQKVSESGDGSRMSPFKEITDVFKSLGSKLNENLDFKIFCFQSDDFQEISKAQLKKNKKLFLTMSSKAPKATIQNVEQSFENVTIDSTLPKPHSVQINKLKSHIAKRVVISGWVQHVRKQSKKLWFVTIRDGYGYLQCVFENKLCNTKDANQLQREATLTVYGTVKELSADNKTVGGLELMVDYWELIHGVELPGGIESIVNADSDIDVQFDNRHLMIRGENTTRIIAMNAVLLRAFRKYYEKNEYTEVDVPTLVKNQCEGGSTLFRLGYFGEDAYLAQSSQLYLESVAPIVRKCFAISHSYRAEKSRTRRHLSEYQHVEAEMALITFEELLDDIEDMMVSISEIVMEINGKLLLEINPDYQPLKKPFYRLEYREAIKFLEEHDIQKPEGGKYEFGDDIPEAAERKMTDIIGRPIMLMKFPASLKAFYMAKCVDEPELTESVDVLIPGVGEIVGGSMRIWNTAELMAAYQREELDAKTYQWYTDLRKVGSCPHGGYGLGFERFATWMMNKDHIRDVVLYPRYTGRCEP